MSAGDLFPLWLHLVALTIYGGTTLALVVIVLPAAGRMPFAAARQAFLARALRLYDPLATAALGVLVVTGAITLTPYKDALRHQFFARMGWLLTWKLTAAFFLLMAGTYLTLGIGHRIVRSHLAGEPIAESQLQGLIRRLRCAALVALVLTAITTWLGLRIGHSHINPP